MIDLNKIGFNITEKPGEPIEVTGGITLTAQVKISKMAPDPEDMKNHAMERIKGHIWKICYGHLEEPFLELKNLLADPEMSCPALKEEKAAKFMEELRARVMKLQEAICEQ